MFLYGLIIVAACGQFTYAETTDKGLVQYLAKCARSNGLDGILDCSSDRILKSLDTIALKQDVEVIPGIHLISDEPINARMAKDTKDEHTALTPQERRQKFTELLINGVSKFLSGRSLKLKIPEAVSQIMARESSESKPKKSLVGPLMLGLGAILVTMVPVMMGGLALLSAKAMLISKLAVVVSLILFVQYFFNSGKSIFPHLSSHSNMVGVAPYTYGLNYPYSYHNPGPISPSVATHPAQDRLTYARSFKKPIL